MKKLLILFSMMYLFQTSKINAVYFKESIAITIFILYGWNILMFGSGLRTTLIESIQKKFKNNNK